MQHTVRIDIHDSNIDQSTDEVLGDVVDDHAMERTERTATGILDDGALDGTDTRRGIVARRLVDERADNGAPSRHGLGGNLIGHRRGRGPGAGAVSEHMQT